VSTAEDDSKRAKRAEELVEATGGRDVVKTSEAPGAYYVEGLSLRALTT
jgi:hypothetical protein